MTQIGLPLPAAPTLIVAGAVATEAHLSLGTLFAGSVAACLIADSGSRICPATATS